MKKAEPVMRRNLMRLFQAYAKVSGLSMSSISNYCHGDQRFYKSVVEKEVTFTVRKYDAVVAWFGQQDWGGAPMPTLQDITHTGVASGTKSKEVGRAQASGKKASGKARR